MTENIAAAKRTIVTDQKKDGLSVRDSSWLPCSSRRAPC